MSEYNCPHCGKEHTLCDWEGEESWIEECYECEKEFEVFAEPRVEVSTQCKEGEHDFQQKDWRKESHPDYWECTRCEKVEFRK